MKFIVDHISCEELEVVQAKSIVRLCTPYGNFGKTEKCHAFPLLWILTLNTDAVWLLSKCIKPVKFYTEYSIEMLVSPTVSCFKGLFVIRSGIIELCKLFKWKNACKLSHWNHVLCSYSFIKNNLFLILILIPLLSKLLTEIFQGKKR